ncbi:hypothetical protein FJTKL_02267 [Diaporthe vaccinii]|uniref:Uncharacterized protein n=1 Tax=Diaporthe vaccinii TaxID=105482 RepID=A0ABR4F3I1_9PEZI
MSLLLKQLVSLTTSRRSSPGSTKVMSTHLWGFHGTRTHRKQRRAVHGQLNDLDGGVVAGLDGGVGGEGHLGQADGRDHGEAHVPGAVVGAVGAEAHVDVEEGRGVALEPARLEGEGAARRGPVCAVCCRWVATACGGEMSMSAYVSEGPCDGRCHGGGRSNKASKDRGRGDLHGYIHCMP